MTNIIANYSTSVTNTATHPAVLVAFPNGALHDPITTQATSLQDIDAIRVNKATIDSIITCNGEFRATPVLVLVQTGYTHTTPARAGDNATYSIQSLLDSAFDRPVDYKILQPRWCRREGPETTHQCRLHMIIDVTKPLRKWVNKYFADPNWIQGTTTSTLLLCMLLEFPSEEALVAYYRTIQTYDISEVTKKGLGI